MNGLMRILVDNKLFIGQYMRNTQGCCNSPFRLMHQRFAVHSGRLWGAPLGEGKSGVKVGIVNTKVVRQGVSHPVSLTGPWED